MKMDLGEDDAVDDTGGGVGNEGGADDDGLDMDADGDSSGGRSRRR